MYKKTLIGYEIYGNMYIMIVQENKKVRKFSYFCAKKIDENARTYARYRDRLVKV